MATRKRTTTSPPAEDAPRYKTPPRSALLDPPTPPTFASSVRTAISQLFSPRTPSRDDFPASPTPVSGHRVKASTSDLSPRPNGTSFAFLHNSVGTLVADQEVRPGVVASSDATIPSTFKDKEPAPARHPSATVDLQPSSSINLDELAWHSPSEQYQWHCDHNPIYAKWCLWRPAPESLLPDGKMAKYRQRDKAAQTEDKEPSITSDLLVVHDALGAERWEGLRVAQRVEETRSKEEPPDFVSDAAQEFWVVKDRQEERFEQIMWLDNLWLRCVAFEAEHGITDEERVRERFKRFPFGVFPTLTERNEAERNAEEGEK